MHRRLLAPILLATTLLFAQTTAVPITAEQHHHLVLDNQYVRVFDVTVPPGDPTLLHQHDFDYIFVTLGDSDISNERQGAAPVEIKLADGDTHFTKGGFAHVARDLAPTPFHNITIELKQPQGDAKPSTEPPSRYCNHRSKTACVAERYLFCTDKLCASDVTMGAKAATIRHSHNADHMVIALTDLDMTDQIEGKPAVHRLMKRGEVAYFPAGLTHRLVNGPHSCRFITLQFR